MRCFLLALALFACSTPLAAATATLHLSGDSEVRGAVLRETDDAVYLDLGFDVLRVPRSSITGLVASVEADEESLEVSGSAEIDDFHEDLSLIRQGIVLVSNPHGFGAGFVVDASGLILTNYHVVGEETFHRLTLYRPGSESPVEIDDVELIAFSRSHDIALLQIDEGSMPADPLVALPLAPQGGTAVGDTCYAIGNPGMGRSILSQTVSEGIVSSLRRNFNDVLYLQTTAAVNPGNSGGPLLNAQGEVIGLITYKAYLENIGFALPVRDMRMFLENRSAFLASDLNPNARHRYLSPEAEVE